MPRIMEIREEETIRRSWQKDLKPASVVQGALLLLLIAFSTLTVFVRHTWPISAFEIGVFALLAGSLLSGIGGTRERNRDKAAWHNWASWLVYAIPFWGLLQLATKSTASTFETRQAVLKWGALAGILFVSQMVMRRSAMRRLALNLFLAFAALMAILCMTQLYTSKGLVFWLFSSGYPDVYATFPSHNNYAQFAELALPVALWGALSESGPSWLFALASGIIYSSVIGSASRAGAVLCTVEILAVVVYGLFRKRGGIASRRAGTEAAILIGVPAVAIVFALAVGWQSILARFQLHDQNIVRREFIAAAMDMAKTRPLLGYGMGTFTEVYQQHATRDFPFYANHAHCDWAEFAADGGFPLLLLVLIPCLAAVPLAIRHPWGWGLIAVMLHACVDYPFPRPAVSGWIFFLVGALYTAAATDRRSHGVRRAPVA